jgi:hypothetical protein
MHLKPTTLILICLCAGLSFCKGNRNTLEERIQLPPIVPGETIPSHIAAIPLPTGFHRPLATATGFTQWLRNISLKKDRTVYLYNGDKKTNQQAQFAVLDISVGTQNLQQCADACMRLRAEYLYSIGNYAAIRFTDNEGKAYQFTQPYNRSHLADYLPRVFGMCGTASLARQMKAKPIADIEPGDVLIRGGFPGHAVIVADMAMNRQGEKIYLLAQSYMPAQDIHILRNPANADDDPWYRVSDATTIITPEYIFRNTELKCW